MMNGRIASFFGEELIVGAFVWICIICIKFFIPKSKNYILFLSILFILTVSFLIGERSNFIKLFICISLFSFIALRLIIFIKF